MAHYNIVLLTFLLTYCQVTRNNIAVCFKSLTAAMLAGGLQTSCFLSLCHFYTKHESQEQKRIDNTVTVYNIH